MVNFSSFISWCTNDGGMLVKWFGQSICVLAVSCCLKEIGRKYRITTPAVLRKIATYLLKLRRENKLSIYLLYEFVTDKNLIVLNHIFFN